MSTPPDDKDKDLEDELPEPSGRGCGPDEINRQTLLRINRRLADIEHLVDHRFDELKDMLRDGFGWRKGGGKPDKGKKG